jgi:transposase
LSLWDSYGVGSVELRAGNFSEDSRGRWYLNVCVPRAPPGDERNRPSVRSILDRSVPSLGIDLGLRTFADFLHNLSTRLVKANGALFVGNVNASALAKTRQAKSVLDAGWSAFRTMLLYKCADAGVWFAEVDEAFSTQTCSVCESRAGPKGRKDLGIRGWQCTVCGAVHDRNVNAAHNILAAGHRRLAEGILGP